ncbi:IclR family transcriptional regulator [Sphingomonas oryzagri]|uniref:IclR family transcriptional regulator n=1 Tax=Sphingomonas oryzagri TaxID=3042314 RepID=A0ABT6MXK6_9SPHN|nr:IclR family transcriptional regulator [Sphingomonas oryzagri]MDH7637248.1 IclR family transcriptional regulator [Sphingomonas oryzagri]
MSQQGKYRAPALQKGLEILELLAPLPHPMSMGDISAALGRSVSEIFRMLLVLEEHGYIARSGEGYRITNRLFSLGMAQPPIQDLLGHALPAMRELAQRIGQSCHLAMASGHQMVVVANVETPGLLGFAVRMGYQRPLIHSASGHVLMAFQIEDARAEMFRATDVAGLEVDRPKLEAELGRVRRAGYITFASPMLTAITDISAPVMRGATVEAALTVPFVDGPSAKIDMAGVRQALLETTAALSTALSGTV